MTCDAIRIAVDEKAGLQRQLDEIDVKKGDIATNIQDVCDIISRAIELSMLAPPKTSDRDELTHEVKSIVFELAPRFFSIPILMLLGTAIFAFLGGWKMWDQEISVRKQAETAIQQITETSRTTNERIDKELRPIIQTEIQRIRPEIDTQIATIFGKPLFWQIVRWRNM